MRERVDNENRQRERREWQEWEKRERDVDMRERDSVY